MATNLNLESLASDYVKNALITKWIVKVGDKVKKGDILLEVETAKVTVEIESPKEGVIKEILFEEDSDVGISETIAIIGDEDDINNLNASNKEKFKEIKEDKIIKKKRDYSEDKKKQKILITPIAKKMALKHDLDLDELYTSMREKGIIKIKERNVISFIETHSKSKNTPSGIAFNKETEIPIKGIRRSIAKKMSESINEKPHVTHMVDADIDDLFKIKKNLEKKFPENSFTLTGLITLAVKKTLQEFQNFNGIIENEKIYLKENINIGIAVDIPNGLVVPVIKNCEKKSGKNICSEVKHLTKAAIKDTLSPDNFMGGTFTITNVGGLGIKYFTPIINKPEIAILGVGAVRTEFISKDGNLKEKKVIGLSLSFDHAAVDGAPAAKFLNNIKENLENMYLLAF